ncbi:ParA family protein [Flavobacterium aquiphilum]|uniref:ParA family protein n=1 Tax=Flavobacterium aquiphilum TaxID=3003261 RepID=UPI00247FAB7E|nr:AAA family ATPase [Flavobacterium aquiphilum]
MKTIVVFNNKGGVGKTTFLCNLASCLQINHNKKVIVIDADPQANATTYTLKDDQTFELFSKINSSGTLNDIFKELRKSGYYFDKELPIIKSNRFGFDIIPGDPSISLFEDFLSKDWFDSINGEARAIRTTLIFDDLNHKLEKLNYDYVFYDVGPSLGAINRSVLMAADYYILPMASDIFSLKAVDNIKASLKSWGDNFKKGLREYEENENEAFKIDGKIINFKLTFIGYITQQYVTKTKDGQKRAVNAYEKIIKQIPKAIVNNLAPINSILSEDNFKLGEIPNLHSLVPLSQSANAPIFKLTADDGVVGAHFSKVKEYGEVIEKIKNNLLTNIAKLS